MHSEMFGFPLCPLRGTGTQKQDTCSSYNNNFCSIPMYCTLAVKYICCSLQHIMMIMIMLKMTMINTTVLHTC